MKLEKILLVAIGFAVGATLTFLARSRPIVSAARDENLRCEERDHQIQKLSEKDYQDYLATTDAALKAKKGDELLAKIMMLFIADLGVRLSQIQAQKNSVSDVPHSDSRGSRPSQDDRPTAAPAGPTSEGRAGLQVTPPRPFVASSEEEIPNAVKAQEKPNLFDTVRSSAPLTSRHVPIINGTYYGEVTFPNGDPPWQVEWTTHVDARTGKIFGSHRLKLSKENKVFSEHSSEGGEIDTFTATQQSLIVRANGDKGYMELFPAQNLGMLVGTYYDKKSVDRFLPIGTIILRRQ